MICYHDMTFCPFWRSCTKGADCHRALTDAVGFDAGKQGLGICQFTSEPDCYEAKPTGDAKTP